jgi:DNA-binding CsgD family transcriptional regulator
LWPLIQDRRAGGVVGMLARTHLALDFVLTGRWEEAERLSDECIDMSERQGLGLLAWGARQCKSVLAAWRGDDQTSQQIVADMMRWATPRRLRAVHLMGNLALHESALGRGDFETAYQCAASITPPGQLPPYDAFAVYILFGMVQAAVRSGRQAEAVAQVRAMEEANLGAISSRLSLVVAGAQAMVASDDDATELFQRAVTLPDADQWPFYLAQVELAFGEHLRRRRAITEARAHLTVAQTIFDGLGARPWSARTATELRATGVNQSPSDRGRGEALTAQEAQVASLAAAGLTNKQIGEKLYMSPRTVGAHLYRVFPKLGITSRAALRDALTGPEQPDEK